jgi:hypothetical protein
MIVRINQFDAANAEPYSGWDDDSLRGPIACELPAGTNAFEILILESDERQQKLAPSFRQGQLRRLLPDILAALREPAEEIVLRLDGPMIAGELLAAFVHLTDARGHGRFAISPVQRFDDLAATPPAVGSVRVHVPVPRLHMVLDDESLGLHRNVRLRAFAVPEPVVNPLLDIDELDDERWPEILAAARFVLGSVRSMQSLQILTHKLSADQTRQRIVQRLSGASEREGM